MNFFALAPLLATIVSLVIGIFVFTRNPGAALNRIFLFFALSLSLWNGGIFMMFSARTADEALLISRILHFGVIFSPFFFIHIVFLVLKLKPRKLSYLAYSLPILLSLSNLGDLFIKDVTQLDYAWYGNGGPAYDAFMLLYLGIVVVFFVIAFKKRKQATSLDKTKINHLLAAKSALLIFGFHDSLPIYSVYTYPFTGLTVYPLFTLGSTIYGILVGYSVLQHQLLDIYTSLGRVAATLVRTAFLLLFYFLCILAIALIFPDQFTYIAIIGSLAAFSASAIVGSVFFPKLIGMGNEFLEERLLGDRFEYQDQARHFISKIPFYPEKKELLSELRSILIDAFELESYFLFIRQKDTDSFLLLDAYPIPSSCKEELLLGPHSTIRRHLTRSGKRRFETTSARELINLLDLKESDRREISDLNATLCFPLRSGNDLLGLMMTGDKTRGRPITGLDVKLCLAMAANLGLFIAQENLKKQVADAQEVELLGNLSRGLAHDLNNLITPIFTYFQLVEQAPDGRESLKEFSLLAKQNLMTVQAYIKESLFFSTNQEPKLRPLRLAELLTSATSLHERTFSERGLRLKISCPDDLEVTLDDVLIQRLVSNLIHNAADASPAGSVIEMTAVPLSRFAQNQKWIRLTVQDYGCGIPEPDLERVFTPYFTTKDTGDKRRGSGLGLSICRRIVDLHNGSISIASEKGAGTRVEVDLPSPLPAEPEEDFLASSRQN